MTHEEMIARFPQGARVRMTLAGQRRRAFMFRRSGGLGVVIGYSRHYGRPPGLKVRADNYRWSSSQGENHDPESWEPTGEVWPRSRWHYLHEAPPAELQTDGVIALHIRVQIDATSITAWPAERIAALFSGLAMIRQAAEDSPQPPVPSPEPPAV